MSGRGQTEDQNGISGDLLGSLERLHASYPQCGCVSLTPAEKWDFGTVVGNGSQGALAFCHPYNDELVLSHEELFLPLYPFRGYLPVREHFEDIRRMVVEGSGDAARDLLRELKEESGFPRYNTTDPFVGAGACDIIMLEKLEIQDYARSIDFETGEALVAWRDHAGVFHRQFFVSRADDVVVVRLSSPSHDKLNVRIGLREIAYQSPQDPKDIDIYEKTIDGCESTVSSNILTHQMRFKNRGDRQPVNGCATVARVINHGGSLSVADNQLCVRDADECLVIIKTVPDRRENPLSVEAITMALEQLPADYVALLAAHAPIHGELFSRCRLTLSAADEQVVSGEALLDASSVGATSPALVEKAFTASRYGVISSTGKLPPALQGVWTGTWKPCWSGDYTLNGNVQSMVAGSLCGNHYECLESLMDYLDSLMQDFRDNASELLGFRGPLIPWRSSTNGRTHYLAYKDRHHDFPGIYWFAGAAWFVQFYYDYYLYTGDQDFLHNRLKPFLLDSVAFYEDFLSLEQDGQYVLAPDSSPENEPTKGIWMAPNATMTIAAIKQLLRSLLHLKDALACDATQVARWRKMLAKLPAYQVGTNGALKEWCWPGIENNEKHRHASHLYPLYFGVDPEIAASDLLREASRVAIDERMAFRRPERGGFMAFGFTQFGLSAAHLGATDLAYESVEYLVNSYWSPIMVSQHNSGDQPAVLNMDISGGLPALVIAMLIQVKLPQESDDGWSLMLLPCLPDAWPQGKLKGARCRGGFEVDLSWKDAQLMTVTIKSLRGEYGRLVYKENSIELKLNAGDEICLNGNLARIL
jgi:alpha-L-fucosidase 2